MDTQIPDAHDLEEDIKSAKAEGKGFWDAEFVPPWDRRRGVRLAGNELPDIDCPVKGNVNRKGDRIYYVKVRRVHAKVWLQPEERIMCFQSVEQASAAGISLA